MCRVQGILWTRGFPVFVLQRNKPQVAFRADRITRSARNAFSLSLFCGVQLTVCMKNYPEISPLMSVLFYAYSCFHSLIWLLFENVVAYSKSFS